LVEPGTSHESKARREWRAFVVLPLIAVVGLVLAACEKPDASDVTSPSARSLLGTTAATSVVFDVDEQPPAATDDPEGWDFFLGNVRYGKLENQQPAIQVVTRIQSQEGAVMDFWIWREGHTALKWSGGESIDYNGVMCFMLRLEEEGESVHLGSGQEQYYFTMGFRDANTGEYAVVKTIEIAGTVPQLDGETPGPESRVADTLLGCPRSVI
jgi:hypothetical protein